MKSARKPPGKRSEQSRPATRPAPRDERFTARLARADKSLLQRAAERRGQTLSAYVFEKARHAAIAELERAGEIVLAPADQQQFLRLMLEPPNANARLRNAINAARAIADRA